MITNFSADIYVNINLKCIMLGSYKIVGTHNKIKLTTGDLIENQVNDQYRFY